MLLPTDGSFWPKYFPIFDFSLTFEETILQILPSGSFIFFASAIVLYYRQKPVRIRRSALLWAKLGFSALLVLLELAGLTLRCMSKDRTDTTYPSASVDLAAVLAISVVIYVEHRHAIRTSALLGLYLAIGVLIDGTKSRSYFKRELTSSGSVSAATAVVRLAILILEEIPKTSLLIDPELRSISNGEVTSGFFSRTFFIFLHPLLYTGFRKILSLEDLDSLGIDFSSRLLFSQLSDAWPAKARLKKHSLFIACCRAWKSAIIAILIPRLFATGFIFAQPFLILSIISAVKDTDAQKDKKDGLIGATFFTFAGAAACRAASTHMKNRLITRARGGILAHLFDKSQKLELSEAKKLKAITLMDADFETIANGLPSCVDIPFVIIESGLGMYFLAHFIRQACLVIFIPLIVATVSGILFGKHLGPAVRQWNESIETRVAKTSHVLAQLPAIKSLGLGPKMEQFVQQLRVIETMVSKKYRAIQAVSMGSAVTVDQMTPVIVVAVALFTHQFGDKITAEVIYPMLSVVAIVQEPLAQLVKAYPSTMAMLECFERIREYLCEAEHCDTRVVVPRTVLQAHQANPSFSSSRTSLEKSTAQSSRTILRFDNAAIAPHGVKTPLLTSVTFSITEGSIVAMFGPTSSGKSTLMQGMLGEAEILSGILCIDETTLSIAFCGQFTFLPNVTVRDCIVGACEYDDVWFNTVIFYCRLTADLEQLPGSADYIIGSDGIQLSGGQRARVGIARAVYARTRAILFDDIFSALDKETAVEILTGLCGKGGLLRQLNCTVVVSSHLQECLEVADEAILLDGNGTVSCEPCKENNVLRSHVARLLQQGLLGKERDTVMGAAQIQRRDAAAAVDTMTLGVQRENDARQRGDLKLYMLWINSIGRKRTFLWLLLVVIMSIFEVLPPIYMSLWIGISPASDLDLVGYALISFSTGVLTFVCLALLFLKLSPRAAIRLHEMLTNSVARATLGFLSTTDSGFILNRFSHDMDLLANRIPSAIYSTLYCGSTVVVQAGVIASGTTYMAASLPFAFICVFYTQRYYLRTSRQLRLLQIEAQAPLVTSLRETSTGLVYIRGFGCQEHNFAYCLRSLDKSQKPYYFVSCSQAYLTLVLDLLTAALAVVLAALALHIKDSTSPNAIGLSFLNLIILSGCLNRTIVYYAAMEMSVGTLARVRDFVRRTPTERRGTINLPENWPSRGKVQVSNIFARYKVDEEDRRAPIVQGVSFTIEPGMKVGIMGRTGSGKSSLLYTLLGFLEYEGSIIIDGVDIAAVEPDQLRSRIITISQDLVALDGTVRDNLLPYDKSWDKTDEAVLDEKGREEAERKDQILRETLVRLEIWESLGAKGGLDATLDDVGYSKGEMQLLCIARAVVRRRLCGSMLVLVDEATASVDRWRDQIVREMMREFFRGCTIIVVAHRTETIADSNMTLHMSAGRLVNVENF
ncbi:hypothetical protein NQ176_g4897 [Zarea fungicola]|uniref:Uncharacterized protein n=1 Tax=Zarea fungicola TaxID=93591 RepID=A0ACC1NC84_9HYPO|nr:hypothetical protein NQ176_g4897 [Lecanicillium fungicola]